MELTLILRDAPEQDDAAYKLLYSLCPRKILYSTDFGGRSLAKSRDLTRHNERLAMKLDATRKIVPFNGASEISPVLPSYLFSGSLDEKTRGNAIGEAFRLFPDVKTVYFDLGVNIDIGSAKAMAAALTKFRSDVNIGVIAALTKYQEDAELQEWVKSDSKFTPCPFLLPTVGIKENLELALSTCGPKAEVFCAYVPTSEALDFAPVIAGSPFPLFVFWSDLSAVNIEFTQKSSCEEVSVPVAEDPYRDMRALFTSTIRSHKSSDAEVIGAVNVSDVVKVLPYGPDADGTAYGQIRLSEGKFGYVVIKHFSQLKFAEVE